MSFLGFTFAILDENLDMMLISTIILWSCNMVYCFENLKIRALFLIFNFVDFLFLISRPAIDLLKAVDTWHNFSDSANMFSIFTVYISLLFLWIGNSFAESIIEKKSKKITFYENTDIEFNHILQFVSSSFFYLSVVMVFIVELEKLLYMRGRNYEEIYVSFKSELPFFVNTLASMCKYFLCIFLATFPSKKKCFLPLVLYVFSAFPYFLIGARYKLVINALFAVTYYVLREFLGKKGEWIGKFEKTVFIIGSPLVLAFLGAYNYIREGRKMVSGGFFGLLIDFFYRQGVSSEILKVGYSFLPKIKYTCFVNYSFGEIIDYVFHGSLAQILFGAKSLGEGQNINLGMYSSLLANRIAYTAVPESFLSGHGWGSSYILDTYADWGYLGIIFFSLFLGILFSYMNCYFKKRTLYTVFILLVLTNVYYCPRSSAFGFLSFIVYLQFYIPFFACFAISMLLFKKYNLKNQILIKDTKGCE